MRDLLVAVCAVLAAGCYDPRPQAGAPCTSTAECPRGLACVGEVCVADGTPDLPDASCLAACSGDSLVCGGETIDCPLGCDAAERRCRDLVPSNGVAWEQVPPGAGALIVPAGETWSLDTRTGVIVAPLGASTGAAVLLRAGAPTIVAAAEVSILGTLNVTGSQAVIFLSLGDLRVGGVLDASAGCTGDPSCAGPGGSPGGDTGVSPGPCGGGIGGGDAPGVDEGGGAGGGHGERGADGGDGSDPPTGDGGTASAMTCGAPTLEPLTGGSGGGFGGLIAGIREGGRGGGGGGAVQLTSRTSVAVTGVIDVGSAGGQHGNQPGGGTDEGGSGSGGAGGGALLKAPRVSVSGTVAANGGGGGGGLANDGQDGQRAATRASGGASGTNSSAGGVGGAKAGFAQPGVDRPTPGVNAGGGGGGAGRIRINVRVPAIAGTISPSPSTADVRTR